jgi:hypothetical protein
MANKTNSTNERELTARLAGWFNETIGRNKFPFHEATCETPAKYDSTTYFGDLLLWINRESRQAYSYIEIKPPFAAKENLETLRKKALSYNVKYCFTWDFQNFNVYELKDNKLSQFNSEPAPVLKEISEWLRGDKQAVIKQFILNICEEIVNLNETGKFRKFIPDKVYFVNYIRKTVDLLIPQFEKHYFDISKDKTKRDNIIRYGKDQGISYNDPGDYPRLIARQSVYSLITKIIFYLTVRRAFSDLPDLYVTDEPDFERYLKTAFAQAQEKDWQAVFEESKIEEFGIPKSCYKDLRNFFSELKVYHFGQLPEDVIGELFEEIIDPEKRHSLGQYFTSENLVDFILGFAVNDSKGFYADTTCGSGTFLIRIYDRLKYLNRKLGHHELLNKIWGFDIAKFPAELATINLFKQDVSNFENFPRVLRSDIFEVNRGDTFEFPPPYARRKYTKAKVTLPEFTSIVGNFPFIRQELIEKTNRGYKQYLTYVLAKDYFLSYPTFFVTNNVNEGNIEHLKKLDSVQYDKEIKRYVEKENIQLKLSGQADIYTYIYIHTATLLADKGQFAVITSNSWLDVSYGSVLKEFFLDHFKVKAVIGSWAEPWFEDAAVNTIITILEKEDNRKERDNNVARFVKLKKKFTELIPHQDLILHSDKRWQTIDQLVNLIESAQDNYKTEIVTEDISSLNLEEMRVRLIKQSILNKEIKDKGEHAKWGKYLRAPDVYFEILDKCKDKLIPLKEIADVRFGIKTGINEFFYFQVLDDKEQIPGCSFCRNAKGWEGYIEEKYLRAIIKSPKESESINIDPAKLKFKIFLCNESKADLRKHGNKYALKYIEWGEKQSTKETIHWPNVSSVSGRTYWWGINIQVIPDGIISCGIRGKYKVFDNEESKVLSDKRMYEIYSKNKYVIPLLNSFLFHLYVESDTRELGDGFIDFTVYEVEQAIMPKAEFLNPTILKLFKKLLKRDIKPILTEYKQKDRIDFDKAILSLLGLEPDIYISKIYNGICEIVKERLELPKMRKTKQKDKRDNAFDKVKEVVIQDCLPDGIRTFPDDFYTKGNYNELEFDSYPAAGTTLTIDSFFTNFQMKTPEGKTVIELDSEVKAEFAALLSKKETFQIKIPKNEKIVAQVLKNYNNYISGLRDQLTANAREKLHDWSIAESMSKEILTDFGIS